jgi:hypothetical protein
MSYITRTGFRLLLWIARTLVDGALTDEQRSDLRWIAIAFNNESADKPER